MALCTVSDVEKVLGIDLGSTDESAVTNLFIPTVEDSIANYIGYNPKYSASITEIFDGDKTEDLFLSRSPVISVSSVTEDGNALVSGNDNDYVVYASLGRLRKVGRENGLLLNYKTLQLFILQVILMTKQQQRIFQKIWSLSVQGLQED